jgi:hypothetical protein
VVPVEVNYSRIVYVSPSERTFLYGSYIAVVSGLTLVLLAAWKDQRKQRTL